MNQVFCRSFSGHFCCNCNHQTSLSDQIPHWQSLLSKRPNCNGPEGGDNGGSEDVDIYKNDGMAVDNNHPISIAVDKTDAIALETTFLNGLRCDCDTQAMVMVRPISPQKAQTQIQPLVPLRVVRATKSKMALTIQLMWQGETLYLPAIWSVAEIIIQYFSL